MLRFNVLVRASAVALLVAVAVAAVLAGCNGSPPVPASTIGVNALAADPAAYSGEIAVKGVVQNVDAAKGSITIIDETEYATCGLTPCNSAGTVPLFLPTAGEPSPTGGLYKGQLPNLEETVVVVGRVVEQGSGLIFDVARVYSGSKTVIEKR